MTSHTASLAPTANNQMTVRDCVFDLMRAFGADTIFGNPGSTELAMFRNFPSDFRYALALQEAVAVGMADGHAQATGKVSFVNLHSAAGVGNAMGNIYTAMKNCTPLVIIAGQQARSILPFDPYLASPQATELPKPYVKWSVEPARAQDVPQAIAQACYRALQAPCGPVLVSVPSDDWDQPAAPVALRTVSRIVRPDPSVLTVISDALMTSERPVVIAGAEVDRGNAWSELVELAERHNASVFNAPMSARAGFPEDHRLFMGFLPAVREQIIEKLEGHDLVLVVGAPVFTYHIEGKGPHVPQGASLFHITQDEQGAARASTGTSLIADVKLTLQDLLTRPMPAQRPIPAPWPPAPPAEASERMTQAFVLQTISELRSPDDIIVEEAPTARVQMHRYLPILRPQTFFTTSSGGLGYGMPAAVGVAMGRPQNKVIAIIGDGSSMYSIQSLWSAAQLRVNVTFIVLNNGVYGAMKRFGGVLGFPKDAYLPGTDLPGLDFVAIAQGQSCPGARVHSPEQLHQTLSAALKIKGPFLLEVVVA